MTLLVLARMVGASVSFLVLLSLGGMFVWAMLAADADDSPADRRLTWRERLACLLFAALLWAGAYDALLSLSSQLSPLTGR